MTHPGESYAGCMEGQISEPQCFSQLDTEDQSKGILHQESSGTLEGSVPQWKAPGEEGTGAPNNEKPEKNADVSGRIPGIESAPEVSKDLPPSYPDQSQNDKLQQEDGTSDHNSLHQLADASPPLPTKEQLVVPPQDSAMVKQEVRQHFESLNQAVSHIENRQALLIGPADSATRIAESTPTVQFFMLIPTLRAHLDKDNDMKLMNVWAQLRKNEVTKEDFLKNIKDIVGSDALKQAAQKVHTQILSRAKRSLQGDQNSNHQQLESQIASKQQPLQSQIASNQQPLQSQIATNQQPLQSQIASQQFSSGGARPTNELQTHQPYSRLPNEVLKSQLLHQTQSFPVACRPNFIDAKGMHAMQASSQIYGNNRINTPVFPRLVNSTPMPFRPQASDPHGRPMPQPHAAQATAGAIAQNLPPSQVASQHNAIPWHGPTNNGFRPTFPPIARNKQELGDPLADFPNKSHTMRRENALFSHIPTKQTHPTLGSTESELQPSGGTVSIPSVAAQSGLIISSKGIQPESSVQVTAHPAATTKIPQKKPSVGQKKPLEGGGPSQQLRKKQKTSGADQTIEQLNDVTAVSGVDLMEEEEQLFSAKDESRISEAARRAVQEEEERFMLQKGPLRQKLLKIAAKCSLKSINSDVERCLSMCAEEHLRGVITALIRQSKQRMDAEKSGHRFVITSDVRRNILHVNRKAKEEWDKKQAEEAQKNKKTNEVSATNGAETEKEKEETRSKNVRVNREEDDKMRTTAANVAARAAVGGDDFLSRWQLMAESKRQKPQGIDNPAGLQPGKAAAASSSPGLDTADRVPQAAEKRGQMTALSSGGGARRPGRFAVSQLRAARSISIKDVISVLERETQMAKSSLIYRLYERAT